MTSGTPSAGLRLVAFIFGLLGAILSCLQGALAALAQADDARLAQFAPFAAAGVGLATSNLVLVGHRRPVVWALLLVIAAAVPVGLDARAWAGAPMAVGGLIALAVPGPREEPAAADDDAPGATTTPG